MSPSMKIESARDLGLMEGFPPPAEKMVTHENQLLAPYNRWSFQHELSLNRVADVWRGQQPVVPLQKSPLSLDGVVYHNRAGDAFTFDDMVEMSYTDGIIVLHRGVIIYERYLNGMQPHSLHAWASGSKSVSGTLAAALAHEGLFDVEKTAAYYLPELKDSGFADASLRQVLDMTTSLRFPQDDHDPISESVEYAMAMGWRAMPPDYRGARNAYEFLPRMKKGGEHGRCFTYLTPNTDVLAWLVRRLLKQSLAEAMREYIWSKLGAGRDAFWIVGPGAVETSGSGLLTTLPDMARFGQMMLQRGFFNGEQIVPQAVVEDIQAGGDRQAFARGLAASPMNQGYSYRSQWWVTNSPYGAYQAMGYGGQLLYIAPGAQLVIAKFSSYPTPTPAGNEFYSASAAFPALAEYLAGLAD